MTTPLGKVVADFKTQLATKKLAGATELDLLGVIDDDGVILANGKYVMTLDGSNNKKEHVIGILDNATKVLSQIKSVSRQGVITDGLARDHKIGCSVEHTDFATLLFLNNILKGEINLDGSTPLKYDTEPTLTQPTHLATKKYVDDASSAGGVDASATVKGISYLSVNPVSPTSPIALGENDPRVPTQDEKDAMVGTSGSEPSATNPFIDQGSLSDGNAIDASQETTDMSVPFGQANATTKYNKINQSFIAGKSPVDNIKLYKQANTGTFTGDVIVSIQTDNAGNPSGTSVGSLTIANATYNALPVGEFTVQFASNVPINIGQTYHIVVEATTADNSNYPSIGANSAGGYADGSVKFSNNADGWTAIATIDLYFKIIIDLTGKIPTLDTGGQLPPSITGSFIQKPSYEDISAGSPLKAVYHDATSKFAKINGIGNIFSTFSPASGTGNMIDAIKLNNTQIVVLYETFNSPSPIYNWYVVVGTLSSGSYSWGTPILVDTVNRGSGPRDDWGADQVSKFSARPSMGIWRSSDTSFIVGGFRIVSAPSASSKYGTAFYVGTVATSTITLGTIQNLGLTVTNTDDYSFYDAVNTGTDEVTIVLNDSPASATDIKVLSINETLRTITVINSNPLGWQNPTRIGLLSSGRVIAFSISGGTDYRVGTISGGVVTLLTSQTGFPVSSTTFCSQLVSAQLDNKGIITSSGNGQFSVYYFTESGGVLTIGSAYVKTVSGFYFNAVQVYDEEEKVYIISYRGSSEIFYMKIQELPPTYTPVPILDYNLKITGNASVIQDTFIMAIVYEKQKMFSMNGTSGQFVSFDWDQFLGFAQNTVVSGETETIDNIGKENTNQSGLLPASVKYYLLASGGIGPVDKVTINSLDYSTGVVVGRPLTKTSIYVNY